MQRPVKLIIEENYMTGDYKPAEDQDESALYEKYVKSRNSVLPFQWGVWVTSLAFANLFKIGSCAVTWIYSDTDSCYGTDWDTAALAAYNESCKARLRERGYGAVEHNGREYWLGICELDGQYKEFVSTGAKRYAVRTLGDTLKITVAGVPKSGVLCLKDNIRNFKKGLVFDGETTGKMQHTYFYEDDIYTDQNGNERGDSIDLSPTTYVLDSVSFPDWEEIFEEEINIQVYDNKIL